MLADEPDNLVLRMLRETRQVLHEARGKVFEHDERFVDLKKPIDDWQETSAAGAGFAARGALRTPDLIAELVAPGKRVEKLENGENRR